MVRPFPAKGFFDFRKYPPGTVLDESHLSVEDEADYEWCPGRVPGQATLVSKPPSRCLSLAYATAQALLGNWPDDSETQVWELIFGSFLDEAHRGKNWADAFATPSQMKGRFRVFFADLASQNPWLNGLDYQRRHINARRDTGTGREPPHRTLPTAPTETPKIKVSGVPMEGTEDVTANPWSSI